MRVALKVNFMWYVALIRGIMPSNPQMSNANFCRVISGLGYKNVQSIISSGNIIFTSSKDSKTIAESITNALQAELGIPGQTIVRSQKELAELIAKKPFGNRSHNVQSYQTVTFLSEAKRHPGLVHDTVEVCLETRSELCIISDTLKTPGAAIMKLLEKNYGKTITTRTWKTVERIFSRLEKLNHND